PLIESAFSSATSETPASEPDADVAFVMRDMTPLLSGLNITPTITNDEVIKRLHETYDWSENSVHHLPVAKNVTGIKFTSAAEARKSGPYANSETHRVPANVTLLPKTTRQITANNAWNERVITVKKGDDVSSILHALNTTVDEINSIIAVLRSHGHDGRIKDGQKLRVLLAPA